MKRETGFVTASVLAVAALFGASTLQTNSGSDGTAPRLQGIASAGKHESKVEKPESGPCDELQGVFVDFFGLKPKPSSGSVEFSADSCNVGQKNITNVVAPNGLETRVVIASLPDPIHTNVPLVFDRDASAIQQAALAVGYNYDSSWLPWQNEASSYALLTDKKMSDAETASREDQPGALLFRKRTLVTKSANLATANLPYDDTLVVLVVGETATSGIHRGQFKHAIEWIKQIRKIAPQAPVQILGPAFSGSLPSLDELLRDPAIANVLKPQGSNDKLQIYSGQITNKTAVDWFLASHTMESAGVPVRFHSFQQDGEAVIRLYLHFLDNIGVAGCHLSIVSEDETAYGSDKPSGLALSTLPEKLRDCAPPPPPCSHCARADTAAAMRNPAEPTRFYYPRDISALRAAYQEQSLFSGSASRSADSSRHTLREDLAGANRPDLTDTIRSYGSSQTALTQEAILLQIVSMMRAHRTQFILLLSSNSLDQIFLTKFFRLTYPEGRVAMLGNDLLLRRDVEANGMDGVTTLSAWPLLPDIDHWTRKLHSGGDSHLHLAFPQNEAQGNFVALSFLLAASPDGDCLSKQDHVTFLPPNCSHIDVPDYRYPFWLKPNPDDPSAQVPATWLTVLGRDGFWPVASLDPINAGATTQPVKVWADSGPLKPPASAIAVVWDCIAGNLHILRCRTPNTHFRDLPLSMNVSICLVLFWACFHLVVHSAPSITVKPTHRTSFVRLRRLIERPLTSRLRPNAHITLVVLGSSFLVLVATLLSWGYGWLSPGGPVAYYPFFYALFPILVWLLGFGSVFANSWVEHRLARQMSAELPEIPRHPSRLKALFPFRFKELRKTLQSSIVALAAYTVLTFAFTCFFLLYLDDRLGPEVRTLTYLRSVNLTTGVSPTVPLVFMALGLYGWCWITMHGLCLFGDDRPVLPPDSYMRIVYTDPISGEDHSESYFSMLDSTHAGNRIEYLCAPFSWRLSRVFLSILVVLSIADALLVGGVPLRSLGTDHYAVIVSVWLALLIGILLVNAWQLVSIWLRLREMLVFLDRLPLRRTLQAMRGISWDSIWKIGGNILDLRYRLFYRQFETLNHLRSNLNELLEKQQNSVQPFTLQMSRASECVKEIDLSLPLRRTFARWYSRFWDDWTARDLSDLKAVQARTAMLAALVLTKLLVPAWSAEKESLLVSSSAAGGSTDVEAEHMRALIEKLPPHIRDAEEIVCLVYLGFIQNILGRMRSIVVGMITLFLAIAFVVPSYPFDPRPLLTGSVVTLFLIAGLTVFSVYSQMFRDTTLSHLTNTKPGELGADFWLKFVGFGIGPVFGLLATIFPQLGNFISSWLEPSISSIR